MISLLGCFEGALGAWVRIWGLGLGFRVWGLGFGVWGLGFGVWGLGFGVWGLGFGVWGLGFGVWGLGFWFKKRAPGSTCFEKRGGQDESATRKWS